MNMNFFPRAGTVLKRSTIAVPAESESLLILTSKCRPPLLSGDTLPRPRLFRDLDGWQTRRLTVIQGPPGCGKTTLVASWLHDHQELLAKQGADVGWVSLDEDDDDPRQFLAYVMAALQPVLPAETRVVEQYLRQGKTDLQPSMTILLNGISRLTHRLLLIVDNYHHIADEQIHQAVKMVLERGPANLHLILISRKRLPPALGPMSAIGGLRILGLDDLRFREEEVRCFVEEVLGFERPSQALLSSLTARSDGWIAGLKLAALAIPTATNLETYTGLIHGHNHWLSTFFRSEFLACQPAEMQTFLLQTSILEALTAQLCTAVTGLPQAARLLEQAVADNLFLTATNESLTRYTYHDLFRELLRAELVRNSPAAEVGMLAQRAAQWLEENGQIGAALRQYLRVGWVEAATNLVERYSLPAILAGDSHRAQRWLNLLNKAGVPPTARLLLDQGWIFLISDRLDTLAYLQSKQDSWRTLLTQSSFDHLMQQEWEMQLAIAHYLASDAAKALEIINHIVDDLSADSHFLVRGGYHFLNLIIYGNCPEVAFEHGRQGLQVYEENGWLTGVIAISRALGYHACQNGEAHEALAHLRSAQRLVDKVEQDLTLEAVYIHFRLGQILYNLNQIEEAKIELRQMVRKAALLGEAIMSLIGEIILSLCSLVEGKKGTLAPALGSALYREIMRDEKPSRQIMIRSWLARYWILAEEEEEAWRAAQRLPVSLDKSPRDQPPIQVITHLSGCIAHDANLAQLEPYLAEVADFCIELNLIEFQLQTAVLQSWYWLKREDITRAKQYLSQAMDMVGQTGYVRYVLDIPDLQPLLGTLPHPFINDYPELFKGIFEPGSDFGLTRQEIQILALLVRNLKNAEIAAELFVTENTVKWHLWNIYRKLGVKRRQAAVSRAQAYSLID
jgi:LuxR family maltose regulon positive regulatory protein